MGIERKISVPLTGDRQKKLELLKESLGVSSNGEVFDKLFDLFSESDRYSDVKAELAEAKRLSNEFHDYLFHLLDLTNKKVEDATRNMRKNVDSLQGMLTEKNEEIEKISKENSQLKHSLTEKDTIISQLIKRKTLASDEDDTAPSVNSDC